MSHTQDKSASTLMGLRYPKGGLRKLLWRMPLVFWRMGLGWALPRNMLIMTTSGRKSGEPRHTMVEHWEMDGAYYVTSGWGRQAQWVKNLLADPIVTVQTVRHGSVTGRAELLRDDAALIRFYNHAAGSSPLWKPYLNSLGIAHNVTDFLAKKERLTIVRMQPRDALGPAPLRADLTGVWLLVALGLIWRLLQRRG